MAYGEFKNAELFVFIESLVFESVLYKGTPKRPFLFEIILCLHQVNMKRDLILNIIHIADTFMIESGTDGLSRRKYLDGMTRGIKPIQFLPLGKGAVERSEKLEPCLRFWWGDNFTSIET